MTAYTEQREARGIRRVPAKLWLALGLSALLLGAVLSRALAPYQHQPHRPDWGDSQWISLPGGEPVGYYRYEFNVAAKPASAHLEIAAPDQFTVYLNGNPIGFPYTNGATSSTSSYSFRSTMEFDDIDVSQLLKGGRNVIAVAVTRLTYPGAASLRVHAGWREDDGTEGRLDSHPGWRTSTRPERQLDGTVMWFNPEFLDEDWPGAVAHPEAIDWVHPEHGWLTPEVFTLLPRGNWIWGGAAAQLGLTFRREFDLGGARVEHAWIGIASRGTYSLTVNRIPIASASPTSPYMDTYDIGPYLRSGRNLIDVDASNLGPDAGVAVSAVVRSGGELLDLSSDGQWTMHTADGHWQAPVLLGSVHGTPVSADKQGTLQPSLRPLEVAIPAQLLWREFLRALPWALLSGLALLVLLVLCLLVSASRRPGALESLALPWLLADCVLAISFLFVYDVRFSEAQVYTMPAILAIVLAAAIWSIAILIEAADERR
jgi:hypothetical protein